MKKTDLIGGNIFFNGLLIKPLTFVHFQVLEYNYKNCLAELGLVKLLTLYFIHSISCAYHSSKALLLEVEADVSS